MSPFIISDVTKKAIDHWLTKYPAEQKRSAVIPSLLLVQKDNNGWLSEPAMEALANYLELPPIYIYEVSTFYDMYELKPIGRHKINVCTNVSCMLRGSDEIVACLKKRLGIGLGETTPDKKFTLRESECLAACGGAPMCQVNDQHYHENLTPKKMLAMIDRLEKECD
jgi:NADH-quinone oxidoreductase subunit E